MPTILGGGISGLSAAYYLVKRYVEPVTVLEASRRVGGWIKTDSNPEKGFIFEAGPRTIRPRGPAAANTLELIEDLGLEKKIAPIYPSHPAARIRMIYARNQLHVLPSSMKGLFQESSLFAKPLIYSLVNDLKAPRATLQMDDESIYDFVERRFGPDIAQYAISPMICGICAGDAKEISVRFLMGDLFDKEQRYGGVIKGIFLHSIFGKRRSIEPYIKSAANSKLAKRAKEERWSIYSLKGGLEQFPKILAKRLTESNVDLRTNTECKQIQLYGDRAILNVNGYEFETDSVISSLPSYRLASLVEQQHPSLAFLLRSIPYVTVAVVNLQYDLCDLLRDEAFGFLVPPSENLPILGVIFDSCCFDMNRKTVLTVMMGGKWFHENFGLKPKPEDILKIAVEQVEKILKIKEKPAESKVRILEKCIPQYTVGHSARVESIRSYIEKNQLPLAVCGAAYDGVGVNDVILSARRTVETLLEC